MKAKTTTRSSSKAAPSTPSRGKSAAARRPTGRRPTPEEIQAAAGGTVADLIGPDLRVLFCGINPSLYSAAVGHHFARPGNRFWPALHLAGYTRVQLAPAEEAKLLASGYGITNLVARATAQAAELAPGELVRGGELLADKVRRLRPAVVAFLGVEAYRKAFDQRLAQPGPQPPPAEDLGDTRIWVLPNPSGLNAHYQLEDLARLYREARLAVRHKPR